MQRWKTRLFNKQREISKEYFEGSEDIERKIKEQRKEVMFAEHCKELADNEDWEEIEKVAS